MSISECLSGGLHSVHSMADYVDLADNNNTEKYRPDMSLARVSNTIIP